MSRKTQDLNGGKRKDNPIEILDEDGFRKKLGLEGGGVDGDGDGGVLIPLLACPVLFKFSCLAEDVSKIQEFNVPLETSCINLFFEPSPSNGLEDKPEIICGLSKMFMSLENTC